VSFAKDNRRRFTPGRARFVMPPFLASPIVRLMAFALVAAFAAAWALVGHYTRPTTPLRVPVPPAPPSAPASAPTFDADAGEIPVPELAPWDGG
jgi:hypothetical protein